jgi:hypothetical protein
MWTALGFALLSVLLLAFGLYTGFHSQRATVFRTVVKNRSLEAYNGNPSSDIAAGKEYGEQFIRAYRAVLEEKAVRSSYDEFQFPSSTNVGGRLLLSGVSECYLYLYPDKESRLEVDGTRFPAQAAVFWHLGEAQSDIKLSVPYETFTGTYSRLPVVFRMPSCFGFVVSEMNFSSEIGLKVFSPGEDCAFAWINSRVMARVPPSAASIEGADSMVVTTEWKNTAILTGAKSFQKVLSSAETLGRMVAEGEVFDLWFKSPFFRKAMTHEKVRPLAEAIEAKRSRAKKDQAFSYPVEEQEKDIAGLKKQIRDMGLAEEFSDPVLKDASEKVKDGVLLLYYPNYKAYVIQWSAVNVVVIVLVLLAWIVRRKYPLVTRIVTIAVIVGVNAFILHDGPQDFPLMNAWLPGALFFAAVSLSLLLGEEPASHVVDGFSA